jgi:hypothetical protein
MRHHLFRTLCRYIQTVLAGPSLTSPRQRAPICSVYSAYTSNSQGLSATIKFETSFPPLDRDYITVYPPSTGSPMPVTHAASSLARNTAARAMSCGVPSPLKGCLASTTALYCCASGVKRPAMKDVCVKPGHRAFTCMRNGAQSIAATFVMPRTACLEVTYDAIELKSAHCSWSLSLHQEIKIAWTYLSLHLPAIHTHSPN